MSAQNSKIGYGTWLEMLRSSLTDTAVVSPLGDKLPAFPSEEMQRNTTSLVGAEALQQANGFYRDISNALEQAGHSIGTDWQVLDFGSCWGRISRFFMRDVPLKNIHGIDVEKSFVEICKDLFNSQNFSLCEALPPTQFAPSSINLITAYSVFSHLSEAAFNSWLLEFHRILSRDGMVAFTTRNELFYNYCKSLQHSASSGYQKALAEMASGVHDFEARYKKGDFIFITGQGVSGGGSMNESFYGEAFIPREYVVHALGGLFEIVDYKTVGNGYDQSLFVLRKKS